MTPKRIITLLAAMGLFTHLAANGQALPGFLNTWTNTGTGNWTDAANWDGANIPDSQGVFGLGDDFAIIDNGGEAIVNSSVAQPGAIPGGIGLGTINNSRGTLTIENGGVLEVLGFENTDADGSVNIGRDTSGLGVLSISGNGSLIAESLATGGAVTTAINLTDTASVSLTGLADLGRFTRITGPNINFSTTGDLQLRTTNSLIAGITGATHSPLKAAGVAVVSGSLFLDFSTTASAGMAWQIVDAGSVAGGFTSIDSNFVLSPGERYATRLSNTGTVNGEALEVFVEEALVLTIDRNTGQTTIENFGSTVSLDAYSVTSANGNLNQASWSQLGGPWEAANPSSTNLSELQQTGGTSFAGAGASTPLGAIFAPVAVTEFGEDVEDVAFNYSSPGGEIIEGIVRYTGDSGVNNLTLIVDPATGQAKIKNTSDFDIAIDAYSVASISGALTPNEWTSLEGSGAFGGGWEEANTGADRVSELLQSGMTPIDSGEMIDLGMLFDEGGGQQDLAFEFLLDTEDTARTGVVVYQTIPVGLPGDYNEDDIVDVADYTVWRDALGTSTALPNRDPSASGNIDITDYTYWRTNFGAVAGSASVASSPISTPEPQSIFTILMFGASHALCFTHRRRHSS